MGLGAGSRAPADRDRRLAVLLRKAELAEVGYPERGATEAAAMPEGYRHVERRVRVGRGEEAFRAARITVLTWGMQRTAGLVVHPAGKPPKRDGTVLAVSAVGPLRVIAPCRVVWTVDEPDRAGFGCGTLPGHPWRGEEAFLAERDERGEVCVVVRAFSRPAAWYARLGEPLTRRVRRRIVDGYFAAFPAG